MDGFVDQQFDQGALRGLQRELSTGTIGQQQELQFAAAAIGVWIGRFLDLDALPPAGVIVIGRLRGIAAFALYEVRFWLDFLTPSEGDAQEFRAISATACAARVARSP